MAITQDEHNELLVQIDALGEKLLAAEGQKETAEAELEAAENDLKELQTGVKRIVDAIDADKGKVDVVGFPMVDAHIRDLEDLVL